MCFASMMSNKKGTPEAYAIDQQLIAGRGNRANEVGMLESVRAAQGTVPSPTATSSSPTIGNPGRSAMGTPTNDNSQPTPERAALKKLMGA